MRARTRKTLQHAELSATLSDGWRHKQRRGGCDGQLEATPPKDMKEPLSSSMSPGNLKGNGQLSIFN